MRVLVTGGTGVIGEGLLPALLNRGHSLRLLTQYADEDVREWPEGVEPSRADITSPADLNGAADDCDAIVHITGIVAETPPTLTFDRVNVGGTRNMLMFPRSGSAAVTACGHRPVRHEKCDQDHHSLHHHHRGARCDDVRLDRDDDGRARRIRR